MSFPTTTPKTLAEIKMDFLRLCSKIAKLHSLFPVAAQNLDMLLILG